MFPLLTWLKEAPLPRKSEVWRYRRKRKWHKRKMTADTWGETRSAGHEMWAIYPQGNDQEVSTISGLVNPALREKKGKSKFHIHLNFSGSVTAEGRVQRWSWRSQGKSPGAWDSITWAG